MKRDMELVRKILLHAEALDVTAGRFRSPRLQIEEYNEAVIAHHLVLMREAGLIEASILETESYGAMQGDVTRITLDGYEFLELARDEKRWTTAMADVARKGGGATIEIITGVLAKLAAQALGLPTA